MYWSFSFPLVMTVAMATSHAASAQAAIPVLNDAGDRLIGIRNVEVNPGQFFDVKFVRGACVQIFAECGSSEGYSFLFDAAGALAASNALSDVMTESLLSTFDIDTEVGRVEGCDGPISCVIRTPHKTIYPTSGTGFVFSEYFFNRVDTDEVGSDWSSSIVVDHRPGTFAVWILPSLV